MKKIFCVILMLLLCLSFTGCANNASDEYVPLKLINEVIDQYGNVLHQTYYNDETCCYILKEYTYTIQQNKWICVNQQTVVYQAKSNDQKQPDKLESYPDANYRGPDLGLPFTY